MAEVEKRKLMYRIFLTIFVLIFLVFAFYLTSKVITKTTGFSIMQDNTKFETCLKEKSIEVYVNMEDLDNLQNLPLFEYSDYMDIINCAKNNEPCLEKGIESFPTWIINNVKVIDLSTKEQLANYAGCEITLK